MTSASHLIGVMSSAEGLTCLVEEQYNWISMKLVADLHIHSHHSIATSKKLVPEYLDLWARIKGINIIGTGDFTHPSWVDELEEKLEPAEEGLYRLRPEFRIEDEWLLPERFGDPVRFLLSAEISNIYKKGGRVRKVHNVVLAPDFETVRRIQASLGKRKFNITSDGRPILGMDSRDLLELVLEISDRDFLIPAHIWTPWFSALGAKSGFDSIEECYRDLSCHIHAVETGLSSDPAMNWMCGFLDKYTLVSNSDAHSPEKLGREANILDTDLSYDSITGAVASGSAEEFLGTIEFFPQEGKYHFDGHRKCGVCWDPLANLEHNGICSGCGKPVTMGVMSRVAQLSDRSDIMDHPGRRPFYSIIPLKEILGEIHGIGPNSRKVQDAYRRIISPGMSEFELLLEAEPFLIERSGGPLLAEGVRRMRNGQVFIQEGYDGEFGVIKLFDEAELKAAGRPESLFGEGQEREIQLPEPRLLRFSLHDYRALATELGMENRAVAEPATGYSETGELFAETQGNLSAEPEEKLSRVQSFRAAGSSIDLNPEQKAAVEHGEGPSMIIAGPGTGKTQVLTRRVLHLVRELEADPSAILAVTFTNKAAGEMFSRIERELGTGAGNPEVSTFHALGYKILSRNVEQAGRGERVFLVDQDDQEAILEEIFGCRRTDARRLREAISRTKQGIGGEQGCPDPEILESARIYRGWMCENGLFDLDDLVCEPLFLLEKFREIGDYWRRRYRRILVDEFQDINRAQYQLIRLLAPEPDSSISVIGDPDQAIYRFRGSDAAFMDEFRSDYPGASIYTLKKSYRCTEMILRASSEVIRRKGFESDHLSGIQEGVRLKIASQPTGRSEAEFVARTIEEMVGGLRSFSIYSRISEGREAGSISSLSDFAVLCRTSRQMELFEEAFLNHAVPFQRVGEGGFLDSPHVKAILDMFRLFRNPGNPYLRLKAEKAGIDLDSEFFLDDGDLDVRGILSRLAGNRVSEPEIIQLLDFAGDYGDDREGFQRLLDLGSEADLYRDSAESVALMTIHAAKGLEFEAVFVPGCEEGLLPFTLYGCDEEQLEEERRLLYVAMTRARSYLFLSHSESRIVFGKKEARRRSRFLDAIEARLVEKLETKRPKRSGSKEDRQLELF